MLFKKKLVYCPNKKNDKATFEYAMSFSTIWHMNIFRNSLWPLPLRESQNLHFYSWHEIMITKKFFIAYRSTDACLQAYMHHLLTITVHIQVYMVIGMMRKHSHTNPKGLISSYSRNTKRRHILYILYLISFHSKSYLMSNIGIKYHSMLPSSTYSTFSVRIR